MEFAVPSDDEGRLTENAKKVLKAVEDIGL
jgi:hypothetical protein